MPGGAEHVPLSDTRPRASPWVLAVALAAAAAGWFLAPQPWPTGEGGADVFFRGARVARAKLEVGDGRPLELTGSADDVSVDVLFPDGVPHDRAVRAHVRVERAGVAFNPGIAGVKLAITLPDGRTELVPMMSWDAKTQRLRAERRPPIRARVVLALLGLVIVLWVTEAVPLFVTSLLVPVVLVFARTGAAKAALEGFFHPIIALFFGGFLLAEAMRRVGLDRRVALTIVARAGSSPALLFAALLGASAFLSMWMSNTAATALLVPIALVVTQPLHHPGYRKAVVLGIAYAGTLGGVGSAIGTPANPLAIEFLEAYAGREISFAGWFLYGLPLVILFLPVMGVMLWRRYKVEIEASVFSKMRAVASRELEESGRPDRGQWTVLAVFAGVMALWLTQTLHGTHPGIVALAGAVALALLGKIRTEDLGRIPWSALITFGGGLTLGSFLVSSGTSDWLATRMVALAGLPYLIGVGAVACLALTLTALASNTATAAVLVPLAIPLAGVLGVDPVLLVLVVAIASSIDFAMVIGTPPTMIAYSTGLYTTREIFRAGVLLDLIGILILITAVVGLWHVLGLVS